jgi:nanoRNase/pAp phosphatase (c-di-AMP/oligoRNAs hydrolase)
MRPSAKEKLKRFYHQFGGNDHVLIPINADPDAIASAMAVKRLLWRKTSSVVIANVNEIRRPDNLAMIRLMGVKLIPFRTVDTKRFSRIAMVDSQPDHHESFTSMTPNVIIDHHPPGAAAKAPFADIRPKYGATASILVEYLRTAKIKPSMKLATALYYAIKTDTSNFERKTLLEDLNAFQYVFHYANTTLAYRIEQAEMRVDFLPYFKRAIEQRRFRKGRAFVHLGWVDHPDICVEIADFFLRVNTVNWSVVTGLHQDKLVAILRNDGIRKNAGTVAKQSFGLWGSAGGHKSAARAEMPVAALEGIVKINDRQAVLKWVIERIERQASYKKN